MIPQNSKKTELLKLPSAPWGPSGWFHSLLIVPSRKTHDSGFAHIAIIGCRVHDDEEMAESIIAWPDDIQWPAQSGISENLPSFGDLRMDAFHPSGVIRLWSGTFEFAVDHPTSSVEIKIRRRAK